MSDTTLRRLAGQRASCPLLAAIILGAAAAVIFAIPVVVAAAPPIKSPVGSQAWIDARRFQLQSQKEFDAAEKRAEKRKAEFDEAEWKSRSENESKEMAGRRIAEINAKLKLERMIDAGFKKEAEAMCLTMTAKLQDPDYEIVKWWKPVESKKLAALVMRLLERDLDENIASRAGVVSNVAILKDKLKKTKDQADRVSQESEIDRLTTEADRLLKEIKRLKGSIEKLRKQGNLKMEKICFIAKVNGRWEPMTWYFYMGSDGSAHLLTSEAEIDIGEAEYGSRKK